VQTDIKRVLAYSTVSQLGYMFMACGVGAYWVAVFHLYTHAFFKALLFLGSGSVIHALSGEQDMRKMGGLRDKIPDFRTMLSFAGHVPNWRLLFARDSVADLSSQGLWRFCCGLITAGDGSTWRLMFRPSFAAAVDATRPRTCTNRRTMTCR
jgi:NADH-quinone oxidoreductase subunit L